MSDSIMLSVPLDHPGVVQPRPHEYVYQTVEELFRRLLPNMAGFLETLRPFLEHPNFSAIPDEQTDTVTPYWNNGYFSGDDARIAYALTASRRPETIMEIGSGNSTKFFRKAIGDFGLLTKLISIDPQPRAEIGEICDEVIAMSVLDVDPDRFSRLTPASILFLDGSHLALNGTDTVHFFLNILPSISEGVLVHIHDICLPNEYVPVFLERYYGEQYMLATLLLNSSTWTPLIPVSYLQRCGLLSRGGLSFWMRRQ